MKRLSIIAITWFLFIPIMNAQNLKEIRLNTPDKTRGANVMKAFADRRSDREFADKALSIQDISDMLWAANGVNRSSDSKRTAPSALNKQDIDVYIFTKEGAYLYDAHLHALKPIAEGDHRALLAGGQDFVKTAPVCLVFVSDLSRFEMGASEQVKMMGAMDAGIVSQNVNLFCSGVGLSTVPRATMDKEGVKRILKLSDSQLPIMNNPVGYPK